MPILGALQSAAIRLMGQKPSTFYGSDGKLEVELCDMANEVAADIAKYADWQALVRIATIPGDGTADEFDLPGDYDRMLLDGSLYSGSWAFGYSQFGDINSFLHASEYGFSARGGWIIYGGKLRFNPAPATATTAKFPYISTNYARAESTSPKSEFTADTDEFLLPDRLLTLGLVWRWRENKGLAGAGDQEAFVKALDEYAAKDKGARVIKRNGGVSMPGTHLAYPWELGPSTYVDH